MLSEIESRGLSLTVAGTDLRLQGPRESFDAGLVERIRSCKGELIAHLSQSRRGHRLTLLQRSYLVGRGSGLESGNVASYIFHEIEGAWDLDRLEDALRHVVRRHGVLRTRFTPEGRQEELPPPVDVRIGRLDLRRHADPDHRVRELRELRSHRILPADQAPLLVVDATIISDDRMVLHVGHDGLIMDGISMFLFFRAWWAAYQGDEDAADEASFADYVTAAEAARARPEAARSQQYWLSRLDSLPPHPDLPLAAAPSAIASPRFTQHCVRLGPASWGALKERARGAGLTPTCLLMTAYAQTLAYWGAGPRFTLNTTIADRPPIHPRMLDAIGNFCDTMLVEITLDQRLSFIERARALQAQLRRDMQHRHFSGIEVTRELARRRGSVSQARMPYTFNSTIGYPRPGVDGSALELFGPEVHAVSQTPQVWLNAFAMEQHGGLVVQLDGVAELFPAGLLGALAEGYQKMLDALGSDAAWDAATFDLLPPEQRARRRLANDTAAPVPEAMLTDAFVGQVRRAPGAPAIWTTRGVISYGELYRRSCYAAAWLREHGVRRDELVAIVMARGPEQIVGILGTLLAGAAYLPVDADLPGDRRDYMLRDGLVRCALTNTEWTDPAYQVLRLNEADSADGITKRADVAPGDLAYVLYTSGTSGAPKGVMISHHSVVNVVSDCTARFGVGPGDRFFAVSAVSFDLSVYDIFGALSTGAAIVMPDRDLAADPAHWLELCARAEVTIWNSVPAIMSMLHDQAAADDPCELGTLRLIMMSGDRIPPSLPPALRRLNDRAALVSLGGPTETTIWNILHPIGRGDDGSRSIPYGKPNANNRAHVLDPGGNDAPDWVPGEICAAGVGLARGYWGDPARTAEKFVVDASCGERLYRTGDLGHYLPNGEIAILGRNDFQLKVNGYRVEASEVETHLLAHPQVKQAAVVRHHGSHGDRLVAHLAATGPPRPPDTELQQLLRRHLPGYMVPSVIVWHESLPLTGNGKVDRRALGAASAPRPAQRAAAEATPEIERAVAELWTSALGVDEVVPTSNLYDLGGDSIAAVRILTAVRKRFGVTIPLDLLPEVDTVRKMAARVGVTAGAS